MRKKIIVGNWKMHKTVQETVAFLRDFKEKISNPNSVDIWIAPSFTSLAIASSAVQELSLPIQIGAQNMHEEMNGAFTGEISGSMLKSVGCSFCIIGHSERREIFKESNKQIHAKIKSALEVDLIPLLCIGEKLEEREKGTYLHLIEEQIRTGLDGLPSHLLSKIILAYEPVWAIGTGKTATSDIAEQTHLEIRHFIAKSYGETIARTMPILYGGSVKADNIASLTAKPNIDGALIGGASLQASIFAEIVHKAS